MAWPQCNTTLENERRTLDAEVGLGKSDADLRSRPRGSCVAWHDLPSFWSHTVSTLWSDSCLDLMLSDMEARNPLSEALGAETVSLPHVCLPYKLSQA